MQLRRWGSNPQPLGLESSTLRCSKAANSVVVDGIWPIQSLMYVLITYKDENNQMKNVGARVVTTLYSYILDAQMQLTL